MTDVRSVPGASLSSPVRPGVLRDKEWDAVWPAPPEDFGDGSDFAESEDEHGPGTSDQGVLVPFDQREEG